MTNSHNRFRTSGESLFNILPKVITTLWCETIYGCIATFCNYSVKKCVQIKMWILNVNTMAKVLLCDHPLLFDEFKQLGNFNLLCFWYFAEIIDVGFPAVEERATLKIQMWKKIITQISVESIVVQDLFKFSINGRKKELTGSNFWWPHFPWTIVVFAIFIRYWISKIWENFKAWRPEKAVTKKRIKIIITFIFNTGLESNRGAIQMKDLYYRVWMEKKIDSHHQAIMLDVLPQKLQDLL